MCHMRRGTYLIGLNNGWMFYVAPMEPLFRLLYSINTMLLRSKSFGFIISSIVLQVYLISESLLSIAKFQMYIGMRTFHFVAIIPSIDMLFVAFNYIIGNRTLSVEL